MYIIANSLHEANSNPQHFSAVSLGPFLTLGSPSWHYLSVLANEDKQIVDDLIPESGLKSIHPSRIADDKLGL